MTAPTRVGVDLLAALFPEGDVVARVARAFELMGVAEEELLAEEKKSRRVRAVLRKRGVFKALYPGELVAYPDPVYRSHCREIIARAKRGEDLRPGTDAELLVMFCRSSLKAPLASEFVLAYETVFDRVYPGNEITGGGRLGRDAWRGRAEEIVEEARRRLARDR